MDEGRTATRGLALLLAGKKRGRYPFEGGSKGAHEEQKEKRAKGSEKTGVRKYIYPGEQESILSFRRNEKKGDQKERACNPPLVTDTKKRVRRDR